MKGRDQFHAAQLKAEKLLQDLGINSLPVDPFDIAKRLGIMLQPMPSTTNGASGMLIHLNGEFGIGYPTHIDNDGFVHFSVAHEIGHYYLPGHFEAVLDENGQHKSAAGSFNGDQFEREADHFAAALLMPARLFSRALRQTKNDLSGIEALRDLCKTSIEATAIRFTEFSKEPIAVIRSEGNIIDYAFMSPPLKDFPDLTWIKKGTPLPTGCATALFNADLNRVNNAEKDEGTSNLDLWFDGCPQEIDEEIIGLGDYGKTLTVLSGMIHPDESDDEDKEASVWDPRFH